MVSETSGYPFCPEHGIDFPCPACASDAVRQALAEILDKHSFDDCGDCDCGVAAEVRGGTQGHHLAEQVMPMVLAAEAAAIEECADATSQDCQVIVTSLGNMQDGDATGEELDRAMKAALHLPKRVRSLLTPARKSALEAKMLEAYNKGLSDGVATIQSDCSDALKRCNDELASLRKENGNG